MFAVILISATATLCLSVICAAIFVALAYFQNRVYHQELLSHARRITPHDTPQLAGLAHACIARLRAKNVQVFVSPSGVLNAYTFGILPPKIVVLNSALLQTMDADELRFVLGHELGHVRLGHTWLNSLVGGMTGIPSPFLGAVLLTLAFQWWNRACEYSADRAGLLACGEPHKAVSALIKLAAGPGVRTPTDLERALRVIEAEDDNLLNNLGEALATHPLMVKRITHLRRYAASVQYRRLQALVNRNIPPR